MRAASVSMLRLSHCAAAKMGGPKAAGVLAGKRQVKRYKRRRGEGLYARHRMREHNGSKVL